MTQRPDPDEPETAPMLDEPDIGSGEKTPAQIETEEIIRQIPPLPAKKNTPSTDDDGKPKAPPMP